MAVNCVWQHFTENTKTKEFYYGCSVCADCITRNII